MVLVNYASSPAAMDSFVLLVFKTLEGEVRPKEEENLLLFLSCSRQELMRMRTVLILQTVSWDRSTEFIQRKQIFKSLKICLSQCDLTLLVFFHAEFTSCPGNGFRNVQVKSASPSFPKKCLYIYLLFCQRPLAQISSVIPDYVMFFHIFSRIIQLRELS